MKVEIIEPTTLNDIKLSQYQKFLRTTKDSEDIEFVNRQIVGIFCDLPDEVVKNITRKSFDELAENITKLLGGVKYCKLKRVIKHNGIEYGFIPNLDEITVGEQADISEYIKDWQKMDKALGVIYRPLQVKRKENYLIQDYKGNEEPLDLPLDVALGAYFFFVNLLKDLLTCIPNYIAEEVALDESLQNLEVNGVGITQSMESLREICLDLKMSLN